MGGASNSLYFRLPKAQAPTEATAQAPTGADEAPLEPLNIPAGLLRQLELHGATVEQLRVWTRALHARAGHVRVAEIDIQTYTQGDGETGRQIDRETWRQIDREIGTQGRLNIKLILLAIFNVYNDLT